MASSEASPLMGVGPRDAVEVVRMLAWQDHQCARSGVLLVADLCVNRKSDSASPMSRFTSAQMSRRTSA